jgi:hypothetical protein
MIHLKDGLSRQNVNEDLLGTVVVAVVIQGIVLRERIFHGGGDNRLTKE